MFAAGKYEYSRVEGEDNDIDIRSELNISGGHRQGVNIRNTSHAFINIRILTTILFAILLASGSFLAGKHAGRTSLDPLHCE